MKQLSQEKIKSLFKSSYPYEVYQLENCDFKILEDQAEGHKGLYGEVGIVAGSPSTPGAAFLATEAAHRMGTGYAHFYYAKPKEPLEIQLKEASFLFHADWSLKDLERCDALVVGCGGAPEDLRVFEEFSKPMIWDAEALRRWPFDQPLRKKNWLLTPHGGEAKELLGSEIKDPLESLFRLKDKVGCSIYLKGAPGVLSFYGDDRVYSSLDQNPVFSRAGAGDVLAGILGGAAARLKSDFEGAILSGLVFQRAVGEQYRGQSTLIASDYLQAFSKARLMLTSINS